MKNLAPTVQRRGVEALAAEYFYLLAEFQAFCTRNATNPAWLPSEQFPRSGSSMQALGIQRGTYVSKHGTPLLIDPHLQKEAHFNQAQQLDHPFSSSAQLPLDLRFAAEGVIRLGGDIVHYRRRALHALEELSTRARAIDALIKSRTPDSVLRITKDINVGFILCLVRQGFNCALPPPTLTTPPPRGGGASI